MDPTNKPQGPSPHYSLYQREMFRTGGEKGQRKLCSEFAISILPLFQYVARMFIYLLPLTLMCGAYVCSPELLDTHGRTRRVYEEDAEQPRVLLCKLECRNRVDGQGEQVCATRASCLLFWDGLSINTLMARSNHTRLLVGKRSTGGASSLVCSSTRTPET